MDSTSWRFNRLFVVVYLGLGVNACRPLGSHTEYSVTEGQNYCQVFTLPAPWSAKSPGKQWLGLAMEYRWPKDDHHEILVTPEPQEETDYTSANVLTGRMLATPKYRISLSMPVHVATAGEEEWERATVARRWPAAAETTFRLLGGGVGSDVHEGERDPREFRLEGRVLERAGKIWAPLNPILFSPNKKYLALQTWDGWWLWGKTPGSGKLYIDVYEVATAQPIAKIRGMWSDWTPDGAQKDTHWLTDKDLITPFDWDQRSFLLCHLP